MKYSKDEVIQYAQEEDVKFIRLTFCDVFGKQKNVAVMPDELPRAFDQGIPFDASFIAGFGDVAHSELLLHPEPETLMPLPWRSEHGRVVQMLSGITHPDGTPFLCDTRSLLKKAVCEAEKHGVEFTFGTEQEFYLFMLDENGKPTTTPCDDAGYMDIAPEDRGENVRRETCLTLEEMGIRTESSYHEEGPGQNEIDIPFAGALAAADNAMTFQRVVKTVAHRNGLAADFSPKPLADYPGNGFYINVSLRPDSKETDLSHMIAGILRHYKSLAVFMDPREAAYDRLRYHSSKLIRIPAVIDGRCSAEMRYLDPTANPYLSFALIIYAGLDGMLNELPLSGSSINDMTLDGSEKFLSYEQLPGNFLEACETSASSDFIKEHIPSDIISIYCGE